MAHENFHILQEPVSLEELCEVMAKLQKTLRHVINGNIDFTNVRAKSLTAETIDVDKLSAIAADLGHITAGLIEAIDIFGSYIATSRSYPRVELSSTSNLLLASMDANRRLGIYSNHPNFLPGPTLEFEAGEFMRTQVYQGGLDFVVISPNSRFLFSTGGEIRLDGGSVRVKGGVSLDTIPQSNSTATTLPALVAEFNTLLGNLRAMNVLA